MEGRVQRLVARQGLPRRSKTSTVGMRTIMVLDNVTLRVSAARCRDSWYLPVLVVVRYHFAGCALGVATLDERLLRH
jgi:hypothetical protein